MDNANTLRDKLLLLRDKLRDNNQKYWGSVFIIFILSYFLPLGSQANKTVFYLLIFLPALFSLRYSDFSLLSRLASFWLLLALCAYAMLRSVDMEKMLDSFKATAAILALLVAALRLPSLQPEKVKRMSLIFICVLIFYILMNAVHQHFSNGWTLGQRLQPLFGQSRSIIFTADLLLSALAAYSWSCIKTRDLKYMVFANIGVVGITVVFLQSRSIIPVWIGCSSVLIATQVRVGRVILQTVGLTILAGGLVWLALYWIGITHSFTARGDGYRIEIWSAYFLSTVTCGFISGCGWGQELGFIAHDGLIISHPHSMYVQHFYWGGLIGLLLLLACITVPLIKGLRFSCYAAWPLLAGSIALAFDGKSLISRPNERWLLVLVPLVVLIGELARLSAQAKKDP